MIKFRRSIPILLILVVLLAGAIGWGVHKRNERKAAIAKLEEYWYVEYKSSCPKWLEDVIGKEWGDRLFSEAPTVVSLGDGFDVQAFDDAFAALSPFSTIERVIALTKNVLMDVSPIEANELSAIESKGEHLNVLRSLPDLTKFLLTGNYLCGDTGLAHLARCHNLKTVWLFDSSITDAGLHHWKGRSNLRFLSIGSSNVTPEAVEKLQAGLPQCQIELFHDSSGVSVWRSRLTMPSK